MVKSAGVPGIVDRWSPAALPRALPEVVDPNPSLVVEFSCRFKPIDDRLRRCATAGAEEGEVATMRVGMERRVDTRTRTDRSYLNRASSGGVEVVDGQPSCQR